jgi:hypothetical protein
MANYDLARELGIQLDEQPIVTVQSALGEDERRLVEVRLRVAGRAFDTTVTVSDRDEFENKMLVGNRDLDGFLVDTSREQLTTPSSPTVGSEVTALLEFLPPPPSAPALLATLPLAAAFIVAGRTLVGINTFGLFGPVLLAVAFVQTGLPAGLTVFGIMTLAGLLVQPLLMPLRLPRVVRLVNDKLSTKVALGAAGVPVSPTMATIRDRTDLTRLDWEMLPDAWGLTWWSTGSGVTSFWRSTRDPAWRYRTSPAWASPACWRRSPTPPRPSFPDRRSHRRASTRPPSRARAVCGEAVRR